MANAASLSATRRHGMLGAAYVSAAALGFSAKAIMVKLAYAHHIDAVTLLFLRMMFSLPFFALVALWAGRSAATGRLGRRDWLAVAALRLTGQPGARHPVRLRSDTIIAFPTSIVWRLISWLAIDSRPGSAANVAPME